MVKILSDEAFLFLYTSIFETFRLKLSQNKNDLNDGTATLFLVSFSQLPAAKKKVTENGTAVTSLRSFLFRDDFSSSTD